MGRPRKFNNAYGCSRAQRWSAMATDEKAMVDTLKDKSGCGAPMKAEMAAELAALEARVAELKSLLARDEPPGEPTDVDWLDFRALVESPQDIITVIEQGGIIRYESPAVRRMLGYEPDENVGNSGLDLVHPDDRDRVAELMGRSSHLLLIDEEVLRQEGENDLDRYAVSPGAPPRLDFFLE